MWTPFIKINFTPQRINILKTDQYSEWKESNLYLYFYLETGSCAAI